MSIIALSIAIGFSFSMFSTFLIYLVSRRRFFQEAFTILDNVQYSDKPRDKSEFRRYRKLKRMVSGARRRIFLLFIVHLFIFSIMYFIMLITLQTVLREAGYVEIPIPIPLISGRNGGGFYTHPFFLALLSYLTPLYLFIRAVRPVD